MTAKELIEELEKYPPDMIVYKNDSEWGHDEMSGVSIKRGVWVWRGSEHSVQDVLVIE